MERAYNFLDFLRALFYDAIEDEKGRLSSLVNLPSDLLNSYLSLLNEKALMRLFKRAADEKQDKLISSLANAIVRHNLMHIPRQLDALGDFLDTFYPEDALTNSIESLRQAFRFKDSWLTEERVFYSVIRDILDTETLFSPALRAVLRHFDREKTAQVHQVNVVLTFTELSDRLIESYFEVRPFIEKQYKEGALIKDVFQNHLQKGIVREIANTRMKTSGSAIFAENEVFSPDFANSAKRAQELLHSAPELVGEQTYYVGYTFADGMGEYFDLSAEGHSAGLAFAYLKFAGAMEIDHRYLHYVSFWGALSPEGVTVKSIGQEASLRKYEIAKANGIRVIVLEESDFRELRDSVDLRSIRFIDYAEDNVVEVVRDVHKRLQEHLQPIPAEKPTIRDCVKVFYT